VILSTRKGEAEHIPQDGL